eukprot:g6828.t1
MELRQKLASCKKTKPVRVPTGEDASGASGAEDDEEDASGAKDDEEDASGASGAEDASGAGDESGASDEADASGASGAEDASGAGDESGASDEADASGASGAEDASGAANDENRCSEKISQAEHEFCQLHTKSGKTCKSKGKGRCVWIEGACKPRCPPKQLLSRCRAEGATAKDCCSFKPPHNHPLYQKGNVYKGIAPKIGKGRFACCNRDIGMWMPTPLKKENSKFCSDEENEKKSEEDIGAIADAANKFKRTLDSLQEIKQAAVQDFREQYRANEAVEALGDDKNAKLQVKVNEERQSVEGQKTQVEMNKAMFDRLSEELLNETKSSERKVTTIQRQIALIIKSMRKTNRDIRAKKKEEVRLLVKLAACKNKDKKLQRDLAQVRRDLKLAEQKLINANKLLGEKAEEQEKLVRQQNEAKERLENELKAVEQEGKIFKTKFKESEESLRKARKAFMKVNKKLIDSVMSDQAVAFLDVAGNHCDKTCQKIKNWDMGAYIKSPREKLMITVRKHVSTKMKEINKMFQLLKRTQKRVQKLRDFDMDLHKELMDWITKDSEVLGKTLKSLQKELAELTREAEKLQKKCEEISKSIARTLAGLGRRRREDSSSAIKIGRPYSSDGEPGLEEMPYTVRSLFSSKMFCFFDCFFSDRNATVASFSGGMTLSFSFIGLVGLGLFMAGIVSFCFLIFSLKYSLIPNAVSRWGLRLKMLYANSP